MEKFSGPLSRRYGTALFESLRQIFNNNYEEFAKTSEILRTFSKALDKTSLQIFNNPSLSFEQKQEFLDSLLKAAFSEKTSGQVYPCLFRFLSIVIKNKRFILIHTIFDFFLKQADEYLGIVRANIISAHTLPQETVKSFESAISTTLQKRVVFSNFIDESLQCGFLIKIGSVDIDASLKSILSKLKESVY